MPIPAKEILQVDPVPATEARTYGFSMGSQNRFRHA
jgi:hypothetical protein